MIRVRDGGRVNLGAKVINFFQFCPASNWTHDHVSNSQWCAETCGCPGSPPCLLLPLPYTIFPANNSRSVLEYAHNKGVWIFTDIAQRHTFNFQRMGLCPYHKCRKQSGVINVSILPYVDIMVHLTYPQECHRKKACCPDFWFAFLFRVIDSSNCLASGWLGQSDLDWSAPFVTGKHKLCSCPRLSKQ